MVPVRVCVLSSMFDGRDVENIRQEMEGRFAEKRGEWVLRYVEQSGEEAATRTIALNVDEAVQASTGIQRDVETIGGTSRDASGHAEAMRQVAVRLHGGADRLSDEVHAFLSALRRA